MRRYKISFVGAPYIVIRSNFPPLYDASDKCTLTIGKTIMEFWHLIDRVEELN